MIYSQPMAYLDVIRRDPCVWCGGPGGTMEHIMPKSQGGSKAWFNAAGACKLCNNRRKVMTVLDFFLKELDPTHEPCFAEAYTFPDHYDIAGDGGGYWSILYLLK